MTDLPLPGSASQTSTVLAVPLDTADGSFRGRWASMAPTTEARSSTTLAIACWNNLSPNRNSRRFMRTATSLVSDRFRQHNTDARNGGCLRRRSRHVLGPAKVRAGVPQGEIPGSRFIGLRTARDTDTRPPAASDTTRIGPRGTRSVLEVGSAPTQATAHAENAVPPTRKMHGRADGIILRLSLECDHRNLLFTL